MAKTASIRAANEHSRGTDERPDGQSGLHNRGREWCWFWQGQGVLRPNRLAFEEGRRHGGQGARGLAEIVGWN